MDVAAPPLSPETFMKPSSSSVALLRDLFAGSVAGIIQVFIGQPFDLVKVRLQKQSLTNPIYKSAMHCARSIQKYEGSFAFYKGTTAPLIGSCFCTSITFGLNAFAKRSFKTYNEKLGQENPGKLATSQYMICGAIAGAGNSLVATPVEHIRILLQMQTNEVGNGAKFNGPFDAVRSIYTRFGMKMIYRGYRITLLREVISNASCYGFYEAIKSKTCDPNKPANIFWLMFIGALAGEMYWLTSYPLDVVKTKIQSDMFMDPKFSKILDTFKITYQVEGLKGFTKGLGPCLVRTLFTSSATFGIFELIVKMLSQAHANI